MPGGESVTTSLSWGSRRSNSRSWCSAPPSAAVLITCSTLMSFPQSHRRQNACDGSCQNGAGMAEEAEVADVMSKVRIIHRRYDILRRMAGPADPNGVGKMVIEGLYWTNSGT
ncbi:hypothetical protein GCM10010168_47730 [Actinoplanes ianthinogenes]|uniref:Uncharacterized protein n=1 Tax=Actinoplanes ianthinogenes TaxID=122358 RepID=A0ABM7LNS9_9ACTN|nr:hypothetical protein Aiant_15840 [Actinoplanes ianthinogenes]GGR24170.1 hypothetical protein GCM10010168_47730 [Actinoplanes ianthinogenes]